MQIAQVLAGYTLGGADLLRRAMGKKKPEEMAKQRSRLRRRARRRAASTADAAAHIFDLMEKFAGYGFNKSHSAAYALLSYQTAWLKAHYPAAFMAAVLSADMDNTDKVVTLIDECAAWASRVEPPDVNASQYMFTVSGPRSIRYGLGAIKGVGEAAVESMLAERAARGPFRDLRDLCRRIDLKRVNRRVLEALIRSGALRRARARNRATLMHQLPAAMQAGDQTSRARAAGQNDLFGLVDRAGATDAGGDRGDGCRDRAGMERGRAPRRRARDARPLPDRPPDRRVRARAAADHQRPHRRPRRRQRPVGAAARAARRQPRGRAASPSRVWCSRSASAAAAPASCSTIAAAASKSRCSRTSASSTARLIAKDAILVVDGALRCDDFIDDWRLAAQAASSTSTRRASSTRGAGAALARERRIRRRVSRPADAADAATPGAAARRGPRAGPAPKPGRTLRGRDPVQRRRRGRARCSSASSGRCGPRAN